MNGMAISEKNSLQPFVVVSCSAHGHLWQNLLQIRPLRGCLMVALEDPQKLIPYLSWPQPTVAPTTDGRVSPIFLPSRSKRPAINPRCVLCVFCPEEPSSSSSRSDAAIASSRYTQSRREGGQSSRQRWEMLLFVTRETIPYNNGKHFLLWGNLESFVGNHVNQCWDKMRSK